MLPAPRNGGVRLVSGFAACIVLVIWLFPRFWYTKTDAARGFCWLAEQTHLAGWSYREIPVTESAEAVLVADRLDNGEFTDANSRRVRVFSAKRYEGDRNESGLFGHTPDRCWCEVGWKIEPISPDVIEVDVHGLKLALERRLFTLRGATELVYFGGLVGGEPLPYRLDYNLSTALKSQASSPYGNSSSLVRGLDSRYWNRLWESFTSRRPLLGPKQFIRISTPVADFDLRESDKLLRDFLGQWLKPVDYDQELAAWRASRKKRELGQK